MSLPKSSVWQGGWRSGLVLPMNKLNGNCQAIPRYSKTGVIVPSNADVWCFSSLLPMISSHLQLLNLYQTHSLLQASPCWFTLTQLFIYDTPNLAAKRRPKNGIVMTELFIKSQKGRMRTKEKSQQQQFSEQNGYPCIREEHREDSSSFQ